MALSFLTLKKNLLHTIGNVAVSLKIKELRPWLLGLSVTIVWYLPREKVSFLNSDRA